MPFVRMPGVTGKVYVPDIKPGCAKKHNCKDCFSCQMCSDDRCRLCRGEESETQVKRELKLKRERELGLEPELKSEHEGWISEVQSSSSSLSSSPSSSLSLIRKKERRKR